MEYEYVIQCCRPQSSGRESIEILVEDIGKLSSLRNKRNENVVSMDLFIRFMSRLCALPNIISLPRTRVVLIKILLEICQQGFSWDGDSLVRIQNPFVAVGISPQRDVAVGNGSGFCGSFEKKEL